MKNISTIMSGAALAGVAVLFFLHFSQPAKPDLPKTSVKADSHTHGQIAYFDMDSVEQHYDFIKQVREELKKQETNISNELNTMRKGYMGRIQQLQAKAPGMSQQEGEAAQAEINQMQINLQQQEAKLAKDLQDKQFKMMQEINEKIASYLKEYNNGMNYSYIISRSPGDFIYLTDTAFNITNDLIKGLNETHKKTK
jgi:outer membrane protein